MQKCYAQYLKQQRYSLEHSQVLRYVFVNYFESKVTDEELEDLDELEEHPHVYTRKKTVVAREDNGELLEVNIYIVENEKMISDLRSSFNSKLLSVDEGDWVKFGGQ